jgi:hypothetical protein
MVFLVDIFSIVQIQFHISIVCQRLFHVLFQVIKNSACKIQQVSFESIRAFLVENLQKNNRFAKFFW